LLSRIKTNDSFSVTGCDAGADPSVAASAIANVNFCIMEVLVMRKLGHLLFALGIAILSLATGPANAGTAFVSGVGNDANPAPLLYPAANCCRPQWPQVVGQSFVSMPALIQFP
jgi:hypothetical protein